MKEILKLVVLGSPTNKPVFQHIVANSVLGVIPHETSPRKCCLLVGGQRLVVPYAVDEMIALLGWCESSSDGNSVSTDEIQVPEMPDLLG